MAEGQTTRSASVSEPRILIDTSIITVAVVPASAEEETFAAAQHKAEQKEQAQVHELSAMTESTDLSQDDASTEVQQSQKTAPLPPPAEEVSNSKDDGKLSDAVEARSQDGDPQQAQVNSRETQDDQPTEIIAVVSPQPVFVAELEAIVPQPLQVKPRVDFGPVELEAPHQTFILPPRPIAVSTNPEKEVPRASIRQLDDFFKLPTELTIKPGMKPKDFGDSSRPEPIRPLKLKLAKKDGKIVPVQVTSPGGSPNPGVSSPGHKLKVDVVAEIIERLSYTPPGSPIHARSSSSVSSNSAQRWSHRSSRSLAAPAQAPAPPAPGGRAMIDPDFATAGQFEGERKQKKKKKKDSTSSAGSKSGWKTFFRASSANISATPESSETTSMATTAAAAASASAPRAQSGGLLPPSADMMTTSGKDVLWFKGEARKALGLSSA